MAVRVFEHSTGTSVTVETGQVSAVTGVSEKVRSTTLGLTSKEVRPMGERTEVLSALRKVSDREFPGSGAMSAPRAKAGADPPPPLS